MQFVTTILGKWETDQAASVPGHEVYNRGSDLLGGADEIALILAVFVVNDDYHAAVADLGDGVVNSRNRHEGMLTESEQPRKGAGAAFRGRFQGPAPAWCSCSCFCARAWRGDVRRTSRLRPLRGLRRH